jgi:hypothetical protein
MWRRKRRKRWRFHHFITPTIKRNTMSNTALLYHDGCKICLSVVAVMSKLFDQANMSLTIINLETDAQYTAAAEAAGVKKLPSLIFENKVLEIMPHAPIAEFRVTPATT